MTFEKSIEIILKYEGGYNNTSGDPGGETNFGISKRAYPNLNIKELTKAQAIEIYRKDYWQKFKIESYPDSIRLQMFDMSVNMGGKGAVLVLQRTLALMGYTISIDGMLGKQTLTAATIQSNTEYLRTLICVKRIEYYKELIRANNSLSKFVVGWINRSIDVLQKSL